MAVAAAARPKLREFNGEVADEFQLWFKRFELFVPAAAADAPANVPRRHLVLPLYLSGRAFMTYDSLPEATKADYQLTKQALKERLDPQDHALVRRQEFMSLTRGPEEAISAFELRVMRKAAMAFEDFPEAQRDLLCKEQFMRGVGDAELQLHLLTQNPLTIRAAVQLAEQYLQVRKVTVPQLTEAVIRQVKGDEDEGVTSPPAKQSELEALRSDMKMLSDQMKNLMAQQTSWRGRGRARGHRGGNRGRRGRGEGQSHGRGQHHDTTPAYNLYDQHAPDQRARQGSQDRRMPPRANSLQHGEQQRARNQYPAYPADPNEGQYNDRFEGNCYNCGKYGHKSADCWGPRQSGN